jgi:hypothetical protein
VRERGNPRGGQSKAAFDSKNAEALENVGCLEHRMKETAGESRVFLFVLPAGSLRNRRTGSIRLTEVGNENGSFLFCVWVKDTHGISEE